VLWFIVGADATRDGLGLDAIHFVIVPGPHDGLREEEPQYERVIDTEARRWRIVYLLCPCFGLLSTKVNWTVAASRAHAASIRDKAAHVYPAGYEVLLPSTAAQRAALDLARRGHRIGRLRAPPESRRQVSLWLDRHSAGRRCVTITLRNYSYMTDRNSDQAEWVAFAKSLDTAVYFPVFVLDLEQTLSDTPPALTNFTIFREASWNIGLRLALYEASFLNLGINNGPMNLCILSDLVRSLTFKIVTPSVPQASEDFIRAHGFEIGHSPFFLTPAQKWIWENDRADVISREFNAMVSYLECPSRREGVL
jgi:hypothetical protein